MQHTLQYLNISDNNISTLIDLAPLRFLKSINASNNKLHSIEDICDTIKNWYYLHKATFTGNPVSKKHRYRESIIANTQRLCMKLYVLFLRICVVLLIFQQFWMEKTLLQLHVVLSKEWKLIISVRDKV